MFHHILVPLDGSLRAERAIPLAARIARASQGTLILLRVVRAESGEGQGAPFFQETLQAEQGEAEDYLRAITSSSYLSDLAIMLLAPQGSVIATIQAAVQTSQADLLVCCEQPIPQGSHAFLSSFAEQLSQHLSIPLLLLPAREPLHRSLAGLEQPVTYLIAFTGSQPESWLIEPTASLLAALAEPEPGHLRCVPLRSIAARSTRTHLDRHLAVYERPRSGGRSAVLQRARTSVRAEERREPDAFPVFVLSTPLLDEEDDSLQAMCRSPRLLVPSPARKK